MKIKRAKCPDGVSRDRLMFWCPGCDEPHAPDTSWQYNGDAERPTLSPSVLVTGRVLRDGVAVDERCHSFVRDGRIQFLADCTHALAGQTVDLPEWPHK